MGFHSENAAFRYNYYDDEHIQCVYEPDLPVECDLDASELIELPQTEEYLCFICNAVYKAGLECPICSPARLPGNSQSFTYVSTSKSKRSINYALVIDTCCETNELEALLECISRSLQFFTGSRFMLFTLHSSGDVVLHSTSVHNGDYSFTIKNSKVEKNLMNLNIKYFTKHLPSIQQMVDSYCFQPDELHEFLRDHPLKPSGLLNTKGSKRCRRSTGLALFISSIVVSNLNDNTTANKILAFLNGPCTAGPGKVLSRNLKNTIRTFPDLMDNKKNSVNRQSSQFYNHMRKVFPLLNYHVFISNLNQIGLFEMSVLLKYSPMVYQCDSFESDEFQKLWDNYVQFLRTKTIYNVEFSVICSRTTNLTSVLAYPLKKYSEKKFIIDELLMPRSLSVCLSFSSIQKNCADQAKVIQLQLRYTKSGFDYLKVTDVTFINTNKYDINIMVGTIHKQLAFDVFLASCSMKFTSDALLMKLDSQYKKLYNIMKHQTNGNYLEYLYNIRRSILLLNRNTSPDERIIFIFTVLRFKIDKCIKLIIPKILESKLDEKKFIQIRITNEIFIKQALMYIDGGDYIAIRYPDTLNINTEIKKLAETNLKNDEDIYCFPPLYIETHMNASKDRYFKSKILPIDQQVYSEDKLFPDFIKRIQSK